MINLIDKIFFIQFLIGFIFFILGIIMIKFPPIKINELYGYRTSNSMKSIEKWNFSQKYSSLLMMKVGLFSIIFSFLGIFFKTTELIQISVGIVSAILTCAILFLLTERKLKIKFPDS